MSNTIKIKRNSTGTPSSLAAGELAVNTANGNLWCGNTAGDGVLHLNNHLPLAGGTISSNTAYLLDLYRPTTGATNASFLSFDLNNDATSAERITYGLIGARIVDDTDDSEDGELVFRTMLNGTLATRMTLSQGGNLTTTGTITATGGTLSGNLTLNTRLTFSGGSNQYLEIGTNSIALKASSGSVLWNSANQLSTSGGTLTGGLLGTYFRMSDYGEIRADDAELYFENAANNRYWRWKLAEEGSTDTFNYILDHYNGTSTSDVLKFTPSNNAIFSGTITATGCTLSGDTTNGQFLTTIRNTGTQSEDNGLLIETATSNASSNVLKVQSDGDSNIFIVKGNGNVGIGLSSGAINATLHVNGSPIFEGNGSFGGSNATSAKLFVRGGYADFWNSTNSLLRVSHDGTRAKLQGFTGGAYDAIALNPDGGNVSIGSATPISPLTVDGADGIYVRHTAHPGIAFDDTDIADASTPITYISGDGGVLVLGTANRSSSHSKRTASAA